MAATINTCHTCARRFASRSGGRGVPPDLIGAEQYAGLRFCSSHCLAEFVRALPFPHYPIEAHILAALARRPMTRAELVAELQEARTPVYEHLVVLMGAGLAYKENAYQYDPDDPSTPPLRGKYHAKEPRRMDGRGRPPVRFVAEEAVPS